MTKLLRILKVIVINVISFLVLLFIVNWISGFFLTTAQATRYELPNYEKDRDYAKQVFKDYNSVQHQYYPFVGWKTKPYSGKTTTIDQQGQRIHTPPSSELKGTDVVRFFGGSTMWGEGSDDQNTIPALFNKKLPEYEVFNHAQLAYNTRQELDALITLYSKNNRTDLVIFYDGVNDAAFLCPKEINELPGHRLVPMFREKLYVKKSKLVKEALAKAFLENIFRLARKFSKVKKESPYDCLSDPEKSEQIAEIMMRNWELAHEIVTDRGGKFIAILQPSAFVGNPRTDHLQTDQDFKANFAEVYRKIKIKIAERKHPWIYDLSNLFDGNEYIFIDFCHVSPNGNAIMANAIAQIVEKEKKQEPEPE
jgi:hypothetical protein